jgi:hypothetical protein
MRFKDKSKEKERRLSRILLCKDVSLSKNSKVKLHWGISI